jgi:hypothetical protein
LTPREIGVEPGMTIHDAATGRVGIWDGAQTVEPEQFFEHVARGEVQPGPNLAREQARLKILNDQWRAKGWNPLKPGSIGATARPAGLSAAIEELIQSQWERYVQDFIRAYRLDARQREKALEALAGARQEARRYLAARAADVAGWQRGRDVLATAEKDDDALARRRAQLADRRRRRVDPLDKIFEGRLKEGLARLPTAEQRKAAETDGKPPAIVEPRLAAIVGD